MLIKNSRKHLMVGLAAFHVLFAEVVFAKRTDDYVPPPFTIRFAVSLLALAPLACLLSVTSYFLLKKYDSTSSGSSIAKVAAIGTICLMVGAFWAGTDSLNDEMWDPALTGALCLSFILPLRVLIIPSILSLRKRIVIAIVGLLTLPFPLHALAAFWQDFGLSNGLPFSW